MLQIWKERSGKFGNDYLTILVESGDMSIRLVMIVVMYLVLSEMIGLDWILGLIDAKPTSHWLFLNSYYWFDLIWKPMNYWIILIIFLREFTRTGKACGTSEMILSRGTEGENFLLWILEYDRGFRIILGLLILLSIDYCGNLYELTWHKSVSMFFSADYISMLAYSANFVYLKHNETTR